jgi:pimeloyl-ACP methyl ester carboxylesterase
MIELFTGVLLMASASVVSKEVSFPTSDGGVAYADVYGSGSRGLVLAHGARFDKASWKDQAGEFAKAGFRVVAVEFRGYGKSKGGPNSKPGFDDMHLDILAAVKYLRDTGAETVAVLGASMGGHAAANAVVAAPGQIDRLVLLAHAPIKEPEKITGPKLFAVAEGDPIAARVREQYEKAPEPKQLLVLSGSAHAQFLFTTAENERLMREMIAFLSAKSTAAQ